MRPSRWSTTRSSCIRISTRSKTIAASRKAGLSVTAYSPIARGRVKGDALLSRIGKAHGKTAAQVCLRYLVQQDIIVIPKTSRAERLKENAAIFDFTLDAGRDEGDRGAGEPARQYRQLRYGMERPLAAQAVRLDHRVGFRAKRRCADACHAETTQAAICVSAPWEAASSNRCCWTSGGNRPQILTTASPSAWDNLADVTRSEVVAWGSMP